MRFGRAFGKDRKNGKILVTIRRAQTRTVLLHERLARPNPTQQSQGAQVTRSALPLFVCSILQVSGGWEKQNSPSLLSATSLPQWAVACRGRPKGGGGDVVWIEKHESSTGSSLQSTSPSNRLPLAPLVPADCWTKIQNKIQDIHGTI